MLSRCLGEPDLVPNEFAACPKWQYGTDERSRPTWNIIGSIIVTAILSDRCPVALRHFVLDGFSQWVTGNIVTSQNNKTLFGVSEQVLPLHDSQICIS